MGIAVCGSGLGTLVFPLVMPFIVEKPLSWGFGGAFLFEAALIFLCILFGALMVKRVLIDAQANASRR